MLASQAVGVQMIVQGGNTFGAAGAVKMPPCRHAARRPGPPGARARSCFFVSRHDERWRVAGVVALGAVGLRAGDRLHDGPGRTPAAARSTSGQLSSGTRTLRSALRCWLAVSGRTSRLRGVVHPRPRPSTDHRRPARPASGRAADGERPRRLGWPDRRPARSESLMPEAVIVAAARSPIGRARKGSLQDAPRRPGGDDGAGGAGQGARARPAHIDDLDARLRPARRRAGLQPGPRRSRCYSASTTCPARPSPGTAPRRCRRPDGVPRDQGRRGRRVRLRRRGVVSRYAKGSSDGTARHAATRVFATRSRDGADRRGRPDWHDPRDDGDRARHLHRDGPDRGERRAAARASAARSRTSSAYAARTWPRRRSPTASGTARSRR